MPSAPATPLVSIVVRSMARPTLKRALQSIASQDYPHIEVVVASALGPEHPVPEPSAGRHSVRFVPARSRLTRPEAANAGQDAARGDWITFLDDDDELTPTHISGLVAATQRAGNARLVHSYALAVLADGSTQRFGHPTVLIELYQRNHIHMASALWSRELLARGARFDERFTTHQDWDFFIQCAQFTRFHFEPLSTFRWYADIGSSGSWGGGNVNIEQVTRMCALASEKWQAQRTALFARVQPLRNKAAESVQQGDLALARGVVDELLAVSENDPIGLNLLAGIEQRSGNLPAALAAMARAVDIKPHDPALLLNLAMLHSALGDMRAAQRHARQVLRIAPGHAQARALLARIGAA
jgi:tetratricopeptide (TPR) repeat protein